MARTVRSLFVVAVVVVVGGGSGIAGSSQFQPLQSAQFVAATDGRNYASGYGYAVGGVQASAPAAAVLVGGKTERLYADSPSSAVHVGYAPSAVYKPDLSAYAAASFPLVEQLRRFDPVVRPVQTVVPKVTAVEPSVSVFKTYVDVPVPAYPYPYHTSTVVQQDPTPYYYHHDFNNNQLQLLTDRK